MQIKSILFSAVLFLSPVSVFAGSEHDHGHDHGHSHAPITQGEIETVARSGMLNLVEQNKIDSSWKSVAIEKAIKRSLTVARNGSSASKTTPSAMLRSKPLYLPDPERRVYRRLTIPESRHHNG